SLLSPFLPDFRPVQPLAPAGYDGGLGRGELFQVPPPRDDRLGNAAADLDADAADRWVVGRGNAPQVAEVVSHLRVHLPDKLIALVRGPPRLPGPVLDLDDRDE